jgi:hypothetical protein
MHSGVAGLNTVYRRLCVKANCDGNPPSNYCLAIVQVEGAREWYRFNCKVLFRVGYQSS